MINKDEFILKKVVNIFYFEGIKNFTGKVWNYSGESAYYKNGKRYNGDLPAVEFRIPEQVPHNFTGWCKILRDQSIRYYTRGKVHRFNGCAFIDSNGNKYWFYKNYCWGKNDHFTNETWILRNNELKRKEKLKIFI